VTRHATAQEAAAAGVATFMQMQARELHRQAREAAEKAARMAGAAAAAAGMGADPFANIAGAPPTAVQETAPAARGVQRTGRRG